VIRAKPGRFLSAIARPSMAASSAMLAWAIFAAVAPSRSTTTSSGPASRPAGTTTTSAATQPGPDAGARPVRVDGNMATHELGKVRADSVHLVVFAIENAKDTAVPIRQIRGDCECISAVDPPAELAAKAATRVTARFVVPRVKGTYGSELFVITEDPLRRIIRLRVLCLVVP
jgi:hypothetical protein